MGSGKTTIGRLLAARLDLPFVDNDAVLEEGAGRTAAEIARDDGVEALHASEADVLRGALDARRSAVITAAASTVTDPELRTRLHAEAFVVWLTKYWPWPFKDSSERPMTSSMARLIEFMRLRTPFKGDTVIIVKLPGFCRRGAGRLSFDPGKGHLSCRQGFAKLANEVAWRRPGWQVGRTYWQRGA
jgi:shikimate kinase